MAMTEHERQYTPSEWSKRYKGQEVIQHLVQLAEKVIVDARSLNCQVDIPYGSTERTKYDIYGTNLPPDAPVFIFFHGGYWQEMTKESSCFPVPMLVANGIKVVMVEYDLCPNVRLDDIVKQTKRAIEQILKTLASRSRSVWIAGHSAGAHLAASLLYDENWIKSMKEQKYLSLIKGFVLIAGIYELQPLLQTSFNDALKLTESEIKDYSFIETNTKGKEPISGLKVIVTVGECDSPVFVNNSRAISQSLVNFVDDVEHILLRDNIDHFDILEKLIDSEYFLTKMIIHHMFR